MIPLKWNYSTSVSLLPYDELGPNYFDFPVLENVLVLPVQEGRIVDEDAARKLRKEGSLEISFDMLSGSSRRCRALFDVIKEIWTGSVIIRLDTEEIFRSRIRSIQKPQWVLILQREGK